MATCSPEELLNAGKCFDCLDAGQKSTIELVLLARLAGISDPTTLLNEGKCFDCLGAGAKSTIETQLLCEWAGGG